MNFKEEERKHLISQKDKTGNKKWNRSLQHKSSKINTKGKTKHNPEVQAHRL